MLSRCLALVHVFDVGIWEEWAPALVEVPEVRVTCPPGRGIAEAVRVTRPDAVVEVHKNRGRDLLPFLKSLRENPPAPGTLILKLQTKSSSYLPPALGKRWREELHGPLAGDRAAVRACADWLVAHPEVGAIGAAGHMMQMPDHVGLNAKWMERLLRRPFEELPAFDFPAGSMYWIRPEALAPLMALEIDDRWWEPEPLMTDGNLAHAVERLVGWSVREAGLDLAWKGTNDEPQTTPNPPISSIFNDILAHFPAADGAHPGIWILSRNARQALTDIRRARAHLFPRNIMIGRSSWLSRRLLKLVHPGLRFVPGESLSDLRRHLQQQTTKDSWVVVDFRAGSGPLAEATLRAWEEELRHFNSWDTHGAWTPAAELAECPQSLRPVVEGLGGDWLEPLETFVPASANLLLSRKAVTTWLASTRTSDLSDQEELALLSYLMDRHASRDLKTRDASGEDVLLSAWRRPI
jgi:hypothetical protein